MEEDIKILERIVKEGELVGIYKTDEIVLKAIENLINRNKELEEELNSVKEIYYTQKEIEIDYIPKSKVKELMKKYEWSLEHYDSETSDYKQSQDIGSYMVLLKLLEE